MARTFKTVRDAEQGKRDEEHDDPGERACSSATWMVDASSPVMPAFASMSGSEPVAEDGSRSRTITKRTAREQEDPKGGGGRTASAAALR
jgi:hypothetical protein